MKEPILKINQNLSFRHLMQIRIHEILIVSSFYDAFKLYEDGRLAEMIINEYEALDLETKPKVVRVSTAEHALKKMKDKKFDLIITMARISDINPFEFGKIVKEKYPDIPIVLLAANKKELKWVQTNTSNFTGIDKIFFWAGNSAIFPAIIKHLEDHKNSKRDIQKGMVRTIIVVEDSPFYYSLFLPMIYKIFIKYTLEFIKLEHTDDRRILRMYSRPKILLASNYEEAISYYNDFSNNVLAIISDTRFPKGNKLDPEAGLKFLKTVRNKSFQTPMVVLSKEVQKKKRYFRKLNAAFIDKNSPDFLNELKHFIVKHCGFGKLKFGSIGSKKKIAVNSLRELRDVIKETTPKSIEKHAKNNHFSNWLAIRGYFDLADLLKPISYKDIDNPDEIKSILHNLIEEQLNFQTKDKLIIFNPISYDPEYKYVRIGDGSLGGKGRGLGFLVTYLKEYDFQSRYPNVNIDIPNFAVVATDIYDKFMEDNNLLKKALKEENDEQVNKLFLKAKFNRDFKKDIRIFLKYNKKPLAIRSSSLLEDSFLEPFAGIYRTFMLLNNNDHLKVRVDNLLSTIKLVFASIFSKKAKSFMKSVGHRWEDEKMAVIIQELVGKKHNDYFYPTYSGIMQSYNYYPQQKLKRENGLATVALGLGKTVVEGEKSLKFSPAKPNVIPQFYNNQSVLKNSQNNFYALNYSFNKFPKEESDNLVKLPLSQAEEDGVLELIASTYSLQDRKFVESLEEKGQRVITFANILKWKAFPLADILKDLSEITHKGMGCEVELEFASNTVLNSGIMDNFYILQVRPQITYDKTVSFDEYSYKKEDLIAKSNICLGNGSIDNVKDILFIDPDKFDSLKTIELANEISKINNSFNSDRKYLLIGPGRWGTSDPLLGIPVLWNDISFVKGIVEVGILGHYIEPSFGNHFFQNITSLNVPYFTISPNNNDGYFNKKWLKEQKQINDSNLVKHIKLNDPIVIKVDGKKGIGAI
ncbi:MAG: PEP/pyruvate-binding domain-containing protein, partial [Candidatus Marinimicrobia bacterium]|nr:PEP/pyruvate-binding domain-containing protein [Candidatus Neomarinimicrobiota bacterium]